MAGLIGFVIILVPVLAFWLYTESPKGKKWIEEL